MTRSRYPRPPPVWVHPSFIAEFGAPYIDGTGLEGGSLTISLAFMGLALERLAANPPALLKVLNATQRHATQRMHTRTHALTHARPHSCTHSLMHALTHARTHSCTHSLMHARTHARTHARQGVSKTLAQTVGGIAAIVKDAKHLANRQTSPIYTTPQTGKPVLYIPPRKQANLSYIYHPANRQNVECIELLHCP